MNAIHWIERYDVPNDRSAHEGWAVILIDSAGFLGVVSDYGNFAYHWRHFGDDFKKFLDGLDWDYLYGKLLHGRDGRHVYDADETRRAVAEALQWESKEEQELQEGHDLFEEEGFEAWAQETKIECPWELRRTMPEPQCEAFCKKVWPRFIDLMREGRSTPLQREASCMA